MKLRSIKAGLLPALAALAFSASACHSTSESSVELRGSGAIVLSKDDSHLYIADSDNNQLVIVNRASRAVEKTVAVGKGPEKAIVGADGRVFVSNRFSRSVSVVDPVLGTEVSRITVGTEPTGLALSHDGKSLVVANSTNNTLSVIDTQSLTVARTVETPADPTAVVVNADGKVYVSHARSGLISVLDLRTGQPTSAPMNLTLSPSKTGGEQRTPGMPSDLVLGAGGRIYIPHVQSKQTPTATTVTTGGGDTYAGGGQPGSVPVVANGVATIDTTSNVLLNGPGLEKFSSFGFGEGDCFDCGAPPRKDDSSGGTPEQAGPADLAPPVIMTTMNQQPMSGPSSLAIEPSGQFLYITNMNSGNVAIVTANGLSLDSKDGADVPGFGPSLTNGLIALVKVGSGPKGIAIMASGEEAYVYNSFDESISVLTAQDGQVVSQEPIKIAEVPLGPTERLGRKLFYGADDSRMTNPAAGGIACASCHPNGREDGRTWQFTEGPRNTPTLAGRHLATTAPYHWDGLLNDMHAFKKIVQERMGGSGEDSSFNGTNPLTEPDFNAMLAYLDSLPKPDNPALKEDGTPVNADAAARGKLVFEDKTKANCIECHTGEDHTDNGFHDVGTETHLSLETNQLEIFPNHVNTPALHNLFFTGPYLHDGSLATLRDRVSQNNGDLHGNTSGLTESERDDLVAYLQTL